CADQCQCLRRQKLHHQQQGPDRARCAGGRPLSHFHRKRAEWRCCGGRPYLCRQQCHQQTGSRTDGLYQGGESGQMSSESNMTTYIIAEAGVNHNGSLTMAKQLIDVASAAGADAVQFQTFKANKLVSKSAQKADYQKQTTDADESQHAMIEKLELDRAAHLELIAYCKIRSIAFLSTAVDHDSIELLHERGFASYSIPSGETTYVPYLRHVGSLNKRIILSTGMANLGEIEAAIQVLTQAGTHRGNIAIL